MTKTRSNRWKWIGGAAAIGGLALLGGLRYFLKERATPEPPYLVHDEEGRFAVRDYPGFWVAETTAYGNRRSAIRSGFRTLADYIFARSHDGDTVAMTAPVIEQQVGEGRWKIRFVMPEGEDPRSLPAPPSGVRLEQVVGARFAVVRFAGAPGDYDLEAEELALRGWLRERGDTVVGEPLYAFYNSPAIPGPLRRNEVWLELAVPPPAAD
ncbi:SOUL family heme-binding protein [Sphingomicrobium astaxanthinifaciens]|uniref:SOUL family heme-binding protein n=1 Tax=Sphingomicrobium astaxanthinifaciens TaxID=1227949 RepID=UPI001FCC1181|nr:heme-binding protein [Sphingomicrobium astaxanthinifaciens]MCJ7421137.1 heme-binding protein [Sphingomicrobium astaxanthinifaciens]